MGIWVGNVLRGGVLLSGLFVVAGVALGLLHNGMSFSLQAGFPHSLRAVASGTAARDPLAVIAAGLLVLIATPWVRVAISLALFLHLRDRIYSLICFFLLVMLTLGLFVGRPHP